MPACFQWHGWADMRCYMTPSSLQRTSHAIEFLSAKSISIDDSAEAS